RTLVLTGQTTGQDLPGALTQAAGNGGPVLPADLQLLALAAHRLGVTSAADLTAMGGAEELFAGWLGAVIDQVGASRATLRLLAELGEPGQVPLPVEWAAARAGVAPDVAHAALASLAEQGITRPVGPAGGPDPRYVLAHDVLARRSRELAAPARAAARRAHDLIGSKVAGRQRLSLAELRAVKREGLSPATPDERAVIERSMRFVQMLGGAALA